MFAQSRLSSYVLPKKMNPLLRYIVGFAVLIASVIPASADPNPKGQVFDAEIIRIRMLSRFTGTVKLAAIDTRFVAEMRLKDDVKGLGKKGATVAFAIHSPARDLWISDYSSAAGKLVRLRVSRKPDFPGTVLTIPPPPPTPPPPCPVSDTVAISLGVTPSLYPCKRF